MAFEDLILATGEVITTAWYSKLVEYLNDIVAGAISNLSELVIDVDKDWGGYIIKNLGSPVADGDAYSRGNVIQLADIPTITYAKLNIADSVLVSDIKSTEFNVASKLVKLDASALVPLAQIPNLPASQITSGRFGVSRLEWTTNKLLIGAGAGSNPTEIDPPVSGMDFWSDPQEEVSITSAAVDKSLPNVVVANLPAGVTIIQVFVMLKTRSLENTHATITNKLNGNQYVQVKKSVGGSYTSAILLVDDLWTVAPATREGGDLVIGSIDVKAEVTGNATYNLKVASARADQDNLNLNDVLVGIRVYFQ